MNGLFLVLMISTKSGYTQPPNEISNTEKIYGLSKFWQEVNYNFIFWDRVDKPQWEAAYKKMIVEVQATENDYEYYRLLQRFCATLKDGHTNVYFPEEIANSIITTGFGDYRIFLTNIDGKAIITTVNYSKKDEIPIGTEIIKVNGTNTNQYIAENVKPYISSSTNHVLEDKSIQWMLKDLIGTKYSLELKFPNGEIHTLQLTHRITTEEEVFPLIEKKELLDFKWMENGIAYLSLNSFEDKKIMELFIEKLPELYKAKKLIVDLRYNGGGITEIGFNIMEYLTKDTILYGAKERSRLHIPTYKAWGKFQEIEDTVDDEWAMQSYLSYRDNFYHDFPYTPDDIELEAERIVIPTAILIGHNTASAAEDFLVYADNQSHMVKIGEPTYGSTGQPYMFDLPNGGKARVCTKEDTYPDGREFVGYGIQPDIVVKKSLNDFIENKDVVLDFAINWTPD